MKVISERFMYLLGSVSNLSVSRALPVKVWRSVLGLVKVAIAGPTVLWLASAYRKQLHRVKFIGVTGSCGKTTTRDLIAAVLSSQFRGRKNNHNRNMPTKIARTILRVRPWDDFCVLEIAAAIASGKRILEQSVRMVRPQIGVITNIGTDHISAFHTMEAIAAEKGKLIAALPPQGTAILNADDANVLAMQAKCAGRIVTYGLAPDAMVRAENVRCAWPERLSFTALYQGQSYAVQTQLCGAHWVHSVLAALSVGIVMGVPLAKAVQAIHEVAPPERRMQPLTRSDGVTFIQDNKKASLWSIPATLEFLKDAKAKRKIVVVGSISDYKGQSDRAYLSVARQALAVADYVLFVGSRSSKSLKAKRHPLDEALQAFYTVEAAGEHLRGLLQSGDLVLLKGSKCDHLEELVSLQPTRQKVLHSASGRQACPGESQLTRHPGFGDSLARDYQAGEAIRRPEISMNVRAAGAERIFQAVVGLGNPSEQYQGTPHNAGQRALDLLARSMEGEWTREDQAMVARGEWQGQPVYLIKPLTYMNVTGPMLLQLGHKLGFGPAECVLVHDDIDLPLGTVRVRTSGCDGGHRGVRSVLSAFSTDQFRRVKIGVGRPKQMGDAASHVLTTFSPTDFAVIERACAEAADRALEMIMPQRFSPMGSGESRARS
jgi:aminoacyl-tRNA hydrolase